MCICVYKGKVYDFFVAQDAAGAFSGQSVTTAIHYLCEHLALIDPPIRQSIPLQHPFTLHTHTFTHTHTQTSHHNPYHKHTDPPRLRGDAPGQGEIPARGAVPAAGGREGRARQHDVSGHGACVLEKGEHPSVMFRGMCIFALCGYVYMFYYPPPFFITPPSLFTLFFPYTHSHQSINPNQTDSSGWRRAGPCCCGTTSAASSQVR
jgi:hypothetical protein